MLKELKNVLECLNMGLDVYLDPCGSEKISNNPKIVTIKVKKNQVNL